MPEEIFQHPCFKITEEAIDLEDSSDVNTTITLETEHDEFIFNFAFGTLVNFVRCKK